MNLEEIKERCFWQDGDLFREETAWLIVEVERLREEVRAWENLDKNDTNLAKSWMDRAREAEAELEIVSELLDKVKK